MINDDKSAPVGTGPTEMVAGARRALEKFADDFDAEADRRACSPPERCDPVISACLARANRAAADSIRASLAASPAQPVTEPPDTLGPLPCETCGGDHYTLRHHETTNGYKVGHVSDVLAADKARAALLRGLDGSPPSFAALKTAQPVREQGEAPPVGSDEWYDAMGEAVERSPIGGAYWPAQQPPAVLPVPTGCKGCAEGMVIEDGLHRPDPGRWDGITCTACPSCQHPAHAGRCARPACKCDKSLAAFLPPAVLPVETPRLCKTCCGFKLVPGPTGDGHPCPTCQQPSPTAGPGPACADCGKSDETVHPCKVCEKPLCDGCAEDDEKSCCPTAEAREPDECDNCGTPMDGHAAATSDVCLDCWRAAKEKLAAAPPPSIGEPAWEAARKLLLEVVDCEPASPEMHRRILEHLFPRKNQASATAPPRKTPGELALEVAHRIANRFDAACMNHEVLGWSHGPRCNEATDDIAALITADRGGR